MIVILLSSIVVTNLVRLPFVFEEGDEKEEDEEEEDDGLENDQSDSSKMSLTEDISKVIENFDKETKALKALMRLKAVKRPERDKGSVPELLDIQKSLLRESGKSQNPENAEKIIEKIMIKWRG
jgi:hypothetical protein